jgi:DNA-binding XRE family transcriptional regulator
MEKLETYLARENIRQADFAVTVGTTQATISKLISGSVTPSLSLAVRIQRATDGCVTCEGWFGAKSEVCPAPPYPTTPTEDAA